MERRGEWRETASTCRHAAKPGVDMLYGKEGRMERNIFKLQEGNQTRDKYNGEEGRKEREPSSACR